MHVKVARNRADVGRKEQSAATQIPIEALGILIEALGRTFGPSCEFVLHELSDLRHSIVAISNGHVTGRRVGDSATAFFGSRPGFRAAAVDEGIGGGDATAEPSESDARVLTSTGREGKRLKSTTVYLRDARKKVVGAICVNIDLSGPLAGLSFLTQFVESGPEERPRNGRPVLEVLEHLLDEAFRQVGAPLGSMTREERVKVVRILKDRGAFMVRGAPVRIARALNVSRHTIYNYLDEQKEG